MSTSTHFKKYNRKYIIIQDLATDEALPSDSEILGEGVCVVHTTTGNLEDAIKIKIGDGVSTFSNLEWLYDLDAIKVDLASPAISVSDAGVVTATTTQSCGYIAGNAPAFTYDITAQVDGADDGFELNETGYWESQNGAPADGEHSTAAVCKINFEVTTACDITFKVINYAESNYDYSVFGNMDTTISTSYDEDVDGSENIYKSFKGLQSASEVDVTYSNVAVGSHFIYVKFRKDGSVDSNNDSVQFKIVEPEGTDTAVKTSTEGLPIASIDSFIYDGIQATDGTLTLGVSAEFQDYGWIDTYQLSGNLETDIPIVTPTASGGGLTAGAGSCAATGSRVTLGTKTTTVPTSGAYVKVTGSGSVSRAAITATSDAGYTNATNTTASAATSKSSNTASAYYPINAYYPNMVNVKFANSTSYSYQVLGHLSTSSSASFSLSGGVMPSTGMLTVSTSYTTSNPLSSYYCPVGSTLIIFCHYGSTSLTSSVSTTTGMVGSSTRCRYVIVPSSATTITLI